MEIKKRILKFLEGTAYLLLILFSVAWAYFFYLILTCGEIVCGEPNRVWLAVEFCLTVAAAALGFFLFIIFLKTQKRSKREGGL